MVAELTVIAKNTSKTIRTKHLIYEKITLDPNNSHIQNAIAETTANFSKDEDPVEDIVIKISMVVR